MDWAPEHKAILREVALGHRDGLGVLADLLTEQNHPLAPLMRHLHAAPSNLYTHGTGLTSGRHGYAGLYANLNLMPHEGGHPYTRVGLTVAHGDEYPHPQYPYPQYPYPVEHFHALVLTTEALDVLHHQAQTDPATRDYLHRLLSRHYSVQLENHYLNRDHDRQQTR